MRNRLLISILFLLSAVATVAQDSKTAVITGYVPEVKDGATVVCLNNPIVVADTVKNSMFNISIPIEKTTAIQVMVYGPGFLLTGLNVYVAPGLKVNINGSGAKFPFWKIVSTLPEQATDNKINALVRKSKEQFLNAELQAKDEAEYKVNPKPLEYQYLKQLIDVLPSMPVDLATVTEFKSVCSKSFYDKKFPYLVEARQLLKSIESRAPKGFEEDFAEMNRMLYPAPIVNVGDKAADADFMDLQGNKHHLSEIKDKYILLSFWQLSVSKHMKTEEQMIAPYNELKDNLEIVCINFDKVSVWQKDDYSKQLVFKNWNDGKYLTGILTQYDEGGGAFGLFVLLSPDHRVIWKKYGYGAEMFNEIKDLIQKQKK